MKVRTKKAALVVLIIPILSLVFPPAVTAADTTIGSTYPVVDTNQTTCYGAGSRVRLSSCPKAGQAYAGQDGNYRINGPRYRDNADGTVSDLVTGLMWQKGFRRNIAWRDAERLAAGADTGGHRDWRVPTIKELYSLIDFSGATGTMRGGMSSVPSDAVPYLDTRVFDFEYPSSKTHGSNVRFIDAQYVTNTAYRGTTMGGNATFFGVNFADGRIKGYPQRGKRGGSGWYVRFVRGNPDYGKNQFRDDGRGGIVDLATGLAWMAADSGHPHFKPALGEAHYRDGRLDWPEALEFCEGLDFAGSKDWRLPNAKELHSILDYSRSPQATRSAAIDPIFRTTAITDEAGKPNFPGYWASTTHLDGRIPGTDAVVVYFGEALGTGSMGQMGGPGGGQMGGQPPPPPGGMGMRPPPGGGFGGRPPPGMHPPRGGGIGPGTRQGGGPQGGGPHMGQGGAIIDVHGAGAQRGDPKIGNPDDYPKSGQGPQGDVRRVYNHVRCVRTAG